MRGRIILLRCLSAIALLAAAGGITASAHDIILGIAGAHFINYPKAQPSMLDLAKKLGVDSIRANASWRRLEVTKGVYKIPPAWDQFVDGALRRGMKPLILLAYGNRLYDNGKMPRSKSAIDGFVRYAEFVVKHFKHRVHYYEIWNEWNTGTGGYYPGGSAVAYARLFDATYAEIKRIDPNTVVLASPGYGNWYEQIASVGVAGRADGVAIHPYVPKDPVYDASSESDGAERSARRVIEAEATMRRLSGGKQIPLYITEIGWPTSTGRRGYPEQQAAAIAERSLLMFAALPYVRGVWWYDLMDDGPDATKAEDRYGLFRRNYTIKPAGEIVRSLASLLKNNELNWNPESNLGAGLVVLNRRGATQPSVIAWDAHASKPGRDKVGSIYALSCNPSLKIVHVSQKVPPADLPIDSVPTVFTFRAHRCTREPLLSR